MATATATKTIRKTNGTTINVKPVVETPIVFDPFSTDALNAATVIVEKKNPVTVSKVEVPEGVTTLVKNFIAGIIDGLTDMRKTSFADKATAEKFRTYLKVAASREGMGAYVKTIVVENGQYVVAWKVTAKRTRKTSGK